MLGKRIIDEQGIDDCAGEAPGLGLLNIETRMLSDKTVRQVNGTCAQSGAPFDGYEIHVGETVGPDCERPMLMIDGRSDGASSENGLISGCYVHGLLNSDNFRHAFLKRIGARPETSANYSNSVESALDELALELEQALDIDQMFKCAKSPGWTPATQ